MKKKYFIPEISELNVSLKRVLMESEPGVKTETTTTPGTVQAPSRSLYV